MTTVQFPATMPNSAVYGGAEVRIDLVTGTARPGHTGSTHVLGSSTHYMPTSGSLSVDLAPNTGSMAGTKYRVRVVDTTHEWMIQLPASGTYLVGNPAIAAP